MSDFSLASDFVLEEKIEFDTIISTYENGYEQRRAKRASGIREFKLQFRNRDISDFVTVRDFLITKLGALTSFTWTNPNDSVEYTVRYKDDSLNFENPSYHIYNFEFTLRQVL
jgi:phage-related protein